MSAGRLLITREPGVKEAGSGARVMEINGTRVQSLWL